MEFKTPTIEDKEEIDRCILADDTRSCDYATANIILWSPFTQISGRPSPTMYKSD